MLKSFVLPDKFWLLIRNNVPIYCFKVASFNRSVLELFSKSFKVFHCSVINVRCCFQQLVYSIMFSSRCQQLFYFSLLSFFRGNSDILSCLSLFVNNFFSTICFAGAQYHLALSVQNCSVRVSFVIIPPCSNFVNQKLQIILYSENCLYILKLSCCQLYFSRN